jgi:hypothetical protein
VTQYTLGLTSGVSHGPAFSQLERVATPAAGAGFTYTNDGRYWERLVAVSFRLVSGSNAANRQVLLTVADGGGVALALFPSASVQTASLTWDYAFLASISNFSTVVGTSVVSPIFGGFLQPRFTVALTIGAVDAADQVSNIRVYVERFVTGDGGYQLGTIEVDDPETQSVILGARILS